MKISLVELRGRISPVVTRPGSGAVGVGAARAGSMGLAAASRLSNVLAPARPRTFSQSRREMKSLIDVPVRSGERSEWVRTEQWGQTRLIGSIESDPIAP